VTNIPLDYWFGAYKFVIAQTRAKFPDVKIILVTCPPTGQAYARRATLNPRILEMERPHSRLRREGRISPDRSVRTAGREGWTAAGAR
jgi:hypothetical protein